MTAPSDGRPELTFVDYLDVLRRHLWLIAIVAVAIPLATFAWSSRQPAVYRASAEVLLSTQNLGSAVTGISTGYVDPGRFGETQAALARVPAVAGAAVARARVPGVTAAELLESSSVAPRDDADFLAFTVDNGRPDHAVRLATAYAEAFTRYKLSADTRTLTIARKELENRLRELRAQGTTRGALVTDLQEKIQNLRTLELLQSPATVVASATEADQISPAPMRSAVVGLLLGLLGGIGLAFLRNTLDRTIRSEDEVERLLALPLLARLPMPERKFRHDERLSMLDDPTDSAAEAVRILRTNLELANSDLGAQVLMVTSAGPGEGKSTTIANLAVALARGGRSVALVDLDLRQPLLANLFGLDGRRGVTDVTRGAVPLAEALTPLRFATPVTTLARSTGTAGSLSILAAGSQTPSPGELMGSESLYAILEELRETHDLILVDAPPLLGVGDAMTLSARVDAVFVVVRLGLADQRTLKELGRALNTMPTRKLGFVLTGVDPRHTYGGRDYGQTPPYRPEATARRLSRPAPEPSSPPTPDVSPSVRRVQRRRASEGR